MATIKSLLSTLFEAFFSSKKSLISHAQYSGSNIVLKSNIDPNEDTKFTYTAPCDGYLCVYTTGSNSPSWSQQQVWFTADGGWPKANPYLFGTGEAWTFLRKGDIGRCGLRYLNQTYTKIWFRPSTEI